MNSQAPSLFYPVKPFHINQAFGNNIPCVKDFNLSTETIVDGADNNTCPPGYTKLYAAFGMDGHDGTDLQAGEQNVYAAADGTVIEKPSAQSEPQTGDSRSRSARRTWCDCVTKISIVMA